MRGFFFATALNTCGTKALGAGFSTGTSDGFFSRRWVARHFSRCFDRLRVELFERRRHRLEEVFVRAEPDELMVVILDGHFGAIGALLLAQNDVSLVFAASNPEVWPAWRTSRLLSLVLWGGKSW